MRVVSFLSDFGSSDSYVAQMKGSVLSRCEASLVDITHEVKKQDINEAAFLLWSVIDHFPKGSVHVAVVDPGVGSSRRGLVVVTPKCVLVGPDNGVLMPAAHKCGSFSAFEIDMNRFLQGNVSSVFHGRDVFAVVAAQIVNGLPFEQIGKKASDVVDLDFGRGVSREGFVLGEIIHIDSFGNCVSNISRSLLPEVFGGVFANGLVGKSSVAAPFVRSYSFVKKGELLSTVGSANVLEFSVNEGSAKKMLGVSVGDSVKVRFDALEATKKDEKSSDLLDELKSEFDESIK